MSQPESFHIACLMGAWIIDMSDMDAAHAAIALCKAESLSALEVRHTLWGVQVRTTCPTAAQVLADRYASSTLALAA